eukprot:TRINITY_DN5071_c0_g2_i1.p1 TRINITY_DN5071_c0_g2~~TRINITY_DN5071_c0_g2_i1.p1  ORF type:complete len:361 (-),score=67.18 TRINITY_DN5071_c0_g2_i1:119-1180(-)
MSTTDPENSSTVEDLKRIDQIEQFISRRMQIYESLGRWPSFSSFEMAANQQKGVYATASGYKVFNLEVLQEAWRKNMNIVSKRKQSVNHWTAGLKKWLLGSWRKDGKAFHLKLNEKKSREAVEVRSAVEELVLVNRQIVSITKSRVQMVHHHHHFYCSCGAPSPEQLDRVTDTCQTDGEVVHHHHQLHFHDAPNQNKPVAAPTGMPVPNNENMVHHHNQYPQQYAVPEQNFMSVEQNELLYPSIQPELLYHQNMNYGVGKAMAIPTSIKPDPINQEGIKISQYSSPDDGKKRSTKKRGRFDFLPSWEPPTFNDFSPNISNWEAPALPTLPSWASPSFDFSFRDLSPNFNQNAR